MGNVVNREKYDYKTSDVKTAGGKRKTVDNGDALSVALRGADREKIDSILKLNGMEDRVEKHKHLNDGMYRMISGQALRALLRKNTPVRLSTKKKIEAL